MSAFRSTGTPFDPSDPPKLDASGGGSGGVVMLSASRKAQVEPWGLHIARALARGWSGLSADLVLVDASLGRSALSAHLGQGRAPGLTEALQGSATVQDVVRGVDGEPFSFIPAGQAEAGGNTLFTSGRWERLCDAFLRAGVTLVVFTPADAPWVSAIAAKASDIVGIASVDESPPLDGIRQDKLRAMLTPPGSWMEHGDGDGGLEDPLGIDPFSRAGAVPRTPDPPFVAERARSPDPPGSTGPGRRSEPHPGPSSDDVRANRSRDFGKSLLYASVLAAVVVGILAWAGWWNGDSRQPDAAAGPPDIIRAPADPSDTSRPPVEVEMDSTAPASVVPMNGDAPSSGEEMDRAAFSVALASYRDPEMAGRQAERMAALWDTTLVFVTPVDVGGETFHRVLAGSYRDSLEAESARANLGTATDADADLWVVRPSHLAFEMGVWETASDAAAHVERLRTSGIESYFLRDSTTGEREHFRVYAGAFGTVEEATALEAMLRAQGLETTLTDRRESARVLNGPG